MRRQKRKIGFSFHVHCSECVLFLHLIKCSLLVFPMCFLPLCSMRSIQLCNTRSLSWRAQKNAHTRYGEGGVGAVQNRWMVRGGERIKLVCGGYSWFMYCSKFVFINYFNPIEFLLIFSLFCFSFFQDFVVCWGWVFLHHQIEIEIENRNPK